LQGDMDDDQVSNAGMGTYPGIRSMLD